MKYARTLFLFAAFNASTTWGGDAVIIVGGGSYARGSQVSIERNTLWIKGILEQKSGFKKSYLFYGAGSTGEPDVITRQGAEREKPSMDPLARVFGQEKQNREQYRETTISGVISSTQADNLKNRLHKIFKTLQSGDTLLFIYQGHGGFDDSGRQDNSLKLWHATRLRVSDLHTLFNDIVQDVKVVFVFPQCYSGAFANLMFENPDDPTTLSKQNRCGFLSQRGDRQAEGCTTSIDSADYRDYSTYFFAALDGKTRTGKPLSGNPDKNGDGVVTFREAHLYALKYGESADLSRSTSEVYLERWMPWYAYWNTTGVLEENDYTDIAEMLAKRSDLEAGTQGSFNLALRRHANLKHQKQTLELERARLETEENGLQKKIQYSLTDRWPELRYPYTANYLKLMRGHENEINRAARANQNYVRLEETQTRLATIEDELLLLLRKNVQLERLYRMRKLSRIQSLFRRSASDNASRAYKRLLECEQTTLR